MSAAKGVSVVEGDFFTTTSKQIIMTRDEILEFVLQALQLKSGS